jgi:hypothetical protein
MLSEAKHLDLFCLGNRLKSDQRFFSRDCGIRMTFGRSKVLFSRDLYESRITPK